MKIKYAFINMEQILEEVDSDDEERYIQEPLPVDQRLRDFIIVERDMTHFIMSCINLFATLVTMLNIIYPSIPLP